MALQNFKHFNNQQSCLSVILCFIYSHFTAEKLTFNLQREVLNIVHTEIFETRELLFVIIQAEIYFKQLY